MRLNPKGFNSTEQMRLLARKRKLLKKKLIYDKFKKFKIKKNKSTMAYAFEQWRFLL